MTRRMPKLASTPTGKDVYAWLDELERDARERGDLKEALAVAALRRHLDGLYRKLADRHDEIRALQDELSTAQTWGAPQ
jgi:hypothetical protein